MGSSEEWEDYTEDLLSARASNEPKVRLNPLVWFAHYPIWPTVWFTLLVTSGLLAFVIHWGFWIATVVFLYVNYSYWRRVIRLFWYFDANPAIVLSVDPMLIAVSTDLIFRGPSVPIVKIFRKNLSSIRGRDPKPGLRLPVVSMYEADYEDPHAESWKDIRSFPIQCGTADPDEIERVFASFSDEEWDELRLKLSQVPRPFKPGLYHTEPEY